MNRVRKRNSSPFGVFLAVLALIVVPVAFADSVGPPGQVCNDASQYALPFDTGQQIVIANITATVNATVEPINRIASGNIAANSGTVNVNDSSPPAGYAAQNFVAVATPAETFREAHSDAILHGLAGQILLTATAPERAVEYNLLC